jgi:hypothetical protein
MKCKCDYVLKTGKNKGKSCDVVNLSEQRKCLRFFVLDPDSMRWGFRPWYCRSDSNYIKLQLCMYREANILAKRAPSTGMRGRQLTLQHCIPPWSSPQSCLHECCGGLYIAVPPTKTRTVSLARRLGLHSIGRVKQRIQLATFRERKRKSDHLHA